MNCTPLEVASAVAEQKCNGSFMRSVQGSTTKNVPDGAVDVGWVNRARDGWPIVYADVVAASNVHADDEGVAGRCSKSVHGRGASFTIEKNKII
jgi:hypothetical protein